MENTPSITLDSLLDTTSNDIAMEKANQLAIRQKPCTKKEFDAYVIHRFKELDHMLEPDEDIAIYRKTKEIIYNLLVNHATCNRIPHIGTGGGRCTVIWQDRWIEYNVLSIRPYREDHIVFAGTSLNKALYGDYRFEVHMTYQAILNMEELINIPEDLLKWNHQTIR
jgi:hypothetical protein